MTYLSRRQIRLTFNLDAVVAVWALAGANTAVFEGLRCSASIVYDNGTSNSALNLTVYGMTESHANALTVLRNAGLANVYNFVQVEAGDVDSSYAVVFAGAIQEAWVDANGTPEVNLTVQAFTALQSQWASVQPVSYRGSVDIAQAVAGIAKTLTPPCAFTNSGVTGKLQNQYLHGDALNQLRTLSRNGNFNFSFDKDAKTLVIWPKGKARTDSSDVKISAKTDMVGYPSYTEKGIILTTLFNPSVQVGAPIILSDSVLTPANGEWIPVNVEHDLESESPSGKWFTHIVCEKADTAMTAQNG